ncbi:DUF5682 family protein [Streptomyces termitum]|uniref:Uncharacterized protein n=1 Tax=Streptomyces termitum TaxID=67368 RepID=A0A918SQX4_9ACTN|nr:DUF5682 family protein [Streptomyces termitum]GHA66623.1 hypothetical protein GCM10010305_05730 [Streptomyces termitum]
MTAPPARAPLLLGVRHHGPGSARAVRAALAAARPAAVLVEGPAEADALAGLAADPDMRPPVALLAHAADDPGRAAFWPFAAFSPEWTALRWALDVGVPVRFADLPAAHTLAADPTWGDGDEDADDAAPAPDPLAELARAAGHEDPERWWEDAVELREGGGADPLAPFEALAEAMTVLRERHGSAVRPRDLVREAHMRLRLRAARKEFGDRIVVVCGAWHVPALALRTTVAADRALLKGLPKVRTELTWVPWTHRRLARRSGYGAGITAPGWYGHLFAAPDRPVERWMTRAAGLLREADHPVSTAHVIEAVRLAEGLAALRGRPRPGLDETTDAVRAVLCGGSDVSLGLVRDRLVIGDDLGEVPAGAPAVPLQRDLTRLQKSLRLKPEADGRDLDLDLRGGTDAARSRLLHRLRLLGVDWGEPAPGRSGTGTFREGWRLSWQPELHVRVAEAGVWGTTVESAATARAAFLARTADTLREVTDLAERCLLAGLGDALPAVLGALADRAALDTDAARLADALPALARALRYGDVRGTDTAALAGVALGVAERICVGLPAACAGLAPAAAEAMRDRLDAVHTAIALLPDPKPDPGTEPDPKPGSGSDPGPGPGPGPAPDPPSEADAVPGPGLLSDRWAGTLRRLAGGERVAGVVRGRAARTLFDGGLAGTRETGRTMGLALSPAVPPAEAAAWIDGFAGGAGGGLPLVHDERLFALLDAWLGAVPDEVFPAVLPLLRRTFGGYDPGVRRALGELAARGPGAAVPAAAAPGFAAEPDAARADAVLPLLRLVLGPEVPA